MSTNITIHKVEKIKTIEIKSYTTDEGLIYYTIEIEIKNREGSNTITLFSDHKITKKDLMRVCNKG